MSSAVERATTMPELLAALVADDATRPRLTWYDDAEGPTSGERIELSARVLANWVAKAAGLLVEELDVERGDVVRLALPPHWRTLYWALACWRVGAVVSLDDDPRATVVVTDAVTDDAAADAVTAAAAESPGRARVVAVSLPALARGWAGPPLPAGALDEAGDLSSQSDVFEPADEPDADDAALVAAGRTWSAAQVLSDARSVAAQHDGHDGARVAVVSTGRLRPEVLLAVLGGWSLGGSVVLVRGSSAALPQRWADERVASVWEPGPPPA